METIRDYMRTRRPSWGPASDLAREEALEVLREWFRWPPDAFLLTASILEDTGLYRFPVVHTPGAQWPPKNWGRDVEEKRDLWMAWIEGTTEVVPPWIEATVQTLLDCLDLKIADVMDWQGKEKDPRLYEFCVAVVSIHAIADAACVGFGLPCGHMNTTAARAVQVAFLANMLLITTGSLSRLPRQHGIVLPKMRTPQVGLTLRSLTLHVTFHRTEVEVRWRALPWVNQDENTINLVVVPFPYAIQSRAFRPFPHPGFAEILGSVRYFRYERNGEPPADGGPFRARDIVHYVREAQGHVHRVNVVVLPEAALTDEDLRLLQSAMALEFAPAVPIIISGVTASGGPMARGAEGESPDGAERMPSNEVVLSTFFAGKWYNIRQSKHHRWRLDCKQIEQYQIAGALTGSQTWWEAIDLPRREVCCLAPNSWLALCPLICEDLARQEPVAEIIRGIGPTLLTAILLDGPQIRERWSARYASVLADDPGSSVLTVTSYGMAARSQPPNCKEHLPPAAPTSVALWKDQRTGFREIVMGAEDGAAVLTMSAEWLREFTSDGRHDGGFASSFSLHGHWTLKRRSEEMEGEASAGPSSVAGDAVDIEELSILTHLADSVLDHDIQSVNIMCRWALGKTEGEQNVRPGPARNLVEEIMGKVKVARSRRARTGKEELLVKPDMAYAVHCFKAVVEKVENPKGDGSDLLQRWTALMGVASRILQGDFSMLPVASEAALAADEALRVKEMVARAILWAIHMRIDIQRSAGRMSLVESLCLREVETVLFTRRTPEVEDAEEPPPRPPPPPHPTPRRMRSPRRKK